MGDAGRRLWAEVAVSVSLVAVTVSSVVAFQVREPSSRFDALVIQDPTRSLDVATTPWASLPAADRVRSAWEGFRAAHGQGWSIYLDRRSGAPLLVEGQGIPWPMAPGATVDSIAASLRTFIAGKQTLLLASDAELVVDHDASAQLSPDVWQIVFGRAVLGVPVAGERYVFTIGHGHLISFGSPRWSRIDASPLPDIDASEAVERLFAYMGLGAADRVTIVDGGSLQLIPLRATGPPVGPYGGALGTGYESALVFRVALTVDGEPGTWAAQIDAHTGAVLSFTDENKYAQVKGGVFPVSDDLICPDGCEQPNYPMPFANVTIDATSQTASTSGLFSCTPGGSAATTSLSGPYVRVVDRCGAISQWVSCDNDIDLAESPGSDCVVPSGSSPGNTHASRTGFYHLNRIAEHARAWLPTRPWLFAQLGDTVNINDTCNAYWDGIGVNFFRSGGGCNNSGEIAGVFLHEWGHGLDDNDGGGPDNPGEAYADITAFMSTHVSCVGRGFYQSGNCDGYGDACLNCSGIREMDFAQHASNTPATPAGFLTTHCGIGDGPCGREGHCEGHVGAETLWDLAVRDLPASGLDLASSWQLADKLWYQSRNGSGGNAYNCALPNSDGCSATSWFAKLRTIDDDDGNLANGTPHAAAIFAAFNRHKIACGAAGDPSNQNHTICPAIGTTSLAATAGSASTELTWTAATGANAYNVLRNDASCAAGSTIIATLAGTSFTDSGLANGFTQYYSVQPVGANPACDGRLSNCQAVTPQPFEGRVNLDATVYSCSAAIHVSVVDANVGAATTTVKLTSAAEPGGETITLTQASPGSANYAGTISTTGSAPSLDGLLSVADGNTITATYIDTDDGKGGVNLTRQSTAAADCGLPIISNVLASNVTDTSARITWDTNEAATGIVHYGPAAPPGSTSEHPARVVGHAVDLTGLSACSSYVYSVESADGVGNTALDNAAGSYYAFATGRDTTQSYVSAGSPVPIPDNSPSGAISTINVPELKVVQSVKVTVNLTHTFDGDLVLTLIPPIGAPIALSNRRGDLGHDFVGTVFDDAAATSISAGSAPFTGSFRPETPLASANGIIAAGAWRLKVVDAAIQDVGTIDSWSLSIRYTAAPCGPHAAYRSNAEVTDVCASGGAGNGDARWDAGEQVSFKVNLNNDGTTPLTGVTATITSTTPGVVMVDGTASYPNLAQDVAADSLAPHFTALLPTSLACGSSVAFQISITSNEGSWAASFTHGIGLVPVIVVPVLNETFAGGIPGTWTVINGGSGGGAAATWTTANPGGRSIAPPMVAPTAIVDSDAAGQTSTQDEELTTPLMDLSVANTVTLQFDQYFRWFSGGLGEVGDVDVRSVATAGAWINVLRQQNAESSNPDHKTLDITPQAAGAGNVQVRFRYFNGKFEWYWQLDNVKIDKTISGTCSQNVCVAGPGIAKPVADGSFGTAMRGSRANASGSAIDLTWDVATCSSTDHHLLFGDLAGVASAAVNGAVCDLGTTGAASWIGAPAGNLWFVVVGDNNQTTEGSWGTKTAGQRGGTTVSGLCGMTARDNSGSCP